MTGLGPHIFFGFGTNTWDDFNDISSHILYQNLSILKLNYPEFPISKCSLNQFKTVNDMIRDASIKYNPICLQMKQIQYLGVVCCV